MTPVVTVLPVGAGCRLVSGMPPWLTPAPVPLSGGTITVNVRGDHFENDPPRWV